MYWKICDCNPMFNRDAEVKELWKPYYKPAIMTFNYKHINSFRWILLLNELMSHFKLILRWSWSLNKADFGIKSYCYREIKPHTLSRFMFRCYSCYFWWVAVNHDLRGTLCRNNRTNTNTIINRRFLCH
jgi:hypothetical protein